jgi:uridine kinase
MNPKIIAICGGSASGKTTFCREIREQLGAECSILYQDSYYIDQSAKFDKDGGSVNFDHPSALEFSLMAQHLEQLKKGQSIQVPFYDFATHTRKTETEAFEPTPYILVDGILILSQECLRPHFDLSLFIHTREDERFQRRLMRDTEERGRTEQGVRDQFYNQVAPMHNEFVEPSKEFASSVYSGEVNFEENIEQALIQIKSL